MNSQTNQYGIWNYLRIPCRPLSHTHCASSHSAAQSSGGSTRKGSCLGPGRWPPHSQMVQERCHWILGHTETGSCQESGKQEQLHQMMATSPIITKILHSNNVECRVLIVKMTTHPSVTFGEVEPQHDRSKKVETTCLVLDSLLHFYIGSSYAFILRVGVYKFHPSFFSFSFLFFGKFLTKYNAFIHCQKLYTKPLRPEGKGGKVLCSVICGTVPQQE